MKRFVTTLAAVALLTACFDDPTSDLRGGPSQIRLSRSLAFLNPGTSVVVEATLLDQQGNVLPGVVSFSTADASVATAADVDTLEGLTETSGEITGVAAGATYVRVAGGGLTDSIFVVVVPTAFNGTISPATATVGQAITVSGTSLFGFNPDSVTVTVDGLPAVVVSATTSQVVFAPPTASGGVVNINGLTVLGNIYIGSMDATTTITVTEANEPANDGPPGATITAPSAVNASSEGYGVLDAPCGWAAGCGGDQGVGDLDDFFSFTTPAGTDSMNFEVEVYWNNDHIDIDGFVLNAGGGGFCVIDGCAGASASDPEVMEVRLAPGTTYTVLVELWDNAGELMPTAYRVKITRVP